MFPTQKIAPCLWFDFKAEEAVGFYLSVFEDGRVLHTTRYNDAGPGPKGAVLTIVFELMGQQYMALNGGPHFRFTEALSLFVGCRTQDEIDFYWDRLSEGGEKGPCGWLKDRYGLSWQIAPTRMGEMISDENALGASRAMAAMMKMSKIDLAALEAAYAGD